MGISSLRADGTDWSPCSELLLHRASMSKQTAHAFFWAARSFETPRTEAWASLLVKLGAHDSLTRDASMFAHLETAAAHQDRRDPEKLKQLLQHVNADNININDVE